MNAFDLKNISWRYKNSSQNTLKNINFSVKAGDFHTFTGENGAGKSTTIRLIVGLSPVFDGQLLINDLDVKQNINARVGISYIPDKAIFPSNLTTFKYLYHCVSLVRYDKKTLKLEIEEALLKYNISEVANKNPNQLSAGQKKKVLLIRSILEKSRIIILDEPVANLDPTTRLQFFEELKNLTREGITIFVSTHILEEIKKYADAATFIKKGEVQWSGKVHGDEIVYIYNQIFLHQGLGNGE